MKHNLFLSILLTSLYITTNAQNDVIAWVPTYALTTSKQVLQKTYGGVAVKDALSQVGLQFWNIHPNGTVNLIDVTGTDVQWFTTWGKQSNVKILLTVVNFGPEKYGYNGFDWRLVRDACYGTRGDTMITNLLKEVDLYNLDGIDLDFEGESTAGGPFTTEDADKYAVFVNKLCDSLHARNKICTADTYPYGPWGCPQPSWWNAWKDKIDAIHGMGYTSTYWNATAERSYQGQQNLAIDAGISPEKYILGMPMWVNNWSGADNNMGISNVENLNSILNCLDHKTGIAMWDIHHPQTYIPGTTDRPWDSDTIWKLIKAIKDGEPADANKCPSKIINPKIIDDMRFTGTNIRGGSWSAFSDYYFRITDEQMYSTKMLTIDYKHDMALEHGSYGDIWPGYNTTKDYGNALSSEIQTMKLAGTADANGGFTMNFLPVDLSLDTTAEAWELGKVGVEQDLSAFQKIVVGAKCNAGKQIRIYLQNKAGAKVYASPYGLTCNCTGQYEDYELPFASLKKMWGTGSTGFDAAHCLKLTIDFTDATPPDTNIISIIGVAVDTSVVGIKNPYTSIEIPALTSNSFSVYPNPAKDEVKVEWLKVQGNTNIIITNMLGQTVFTSRETLTSIHHAQSSRIIDISQFPSGIYIIKLENEVQKFIKQ